MLLNWTHNTYTHTHTHTHTRAGTTGLKCTRWLVFYVYVVLNASGKVWAYSEWNAPPTAGEYYYRWQPAPLSPLSFRCSHRRRSAWLVLHTHLFSSEKNMEKLSLKRQGFCVEVCKVWSNAVAERVQDRWRILGLLRWLPLVQPSWKVTTTTHTTTITAMKLVFWSEDVVT